jgi:hypothetical protein
MRGGKSNTPPLSRADTTNVSRDTAKVIAASQPPPPPLSVAPRVNVARAKSALDDLFLDKLSPATAAMVRDSALKFFNAAAIAADDKAYAAFVVGNAYFNLGDRPTGCRYVRTATTLAPNNNTYLTLLGQCPG